MGIENRNVGKGSSLRRQIIAIQQIGNNVDGTIGVAIAAAGAGTGEFLGAPFARGKGRIVGIFSGNMTTALTVDATMDIMPKKFNPNNGVARDLTGADCSVCPLLTAPGQRLESVAANPANFIGAFEELTAFDEIEYTALLQAPGGANQVKLAAAASAVDGLFADSDIEIIKGLGVGQKNRLTTYEGATKIAKVKNIEGSPNWKVATDATSLARVRTRRYIVDKYTSFLWVVDFTVAGGAAGVDLVTGVEIELDDEIAA